VFLERAETIILPDVRINRRESCQAETPIASRVPPLPRSCRLFSDAVVALRYGGSQGDGSRRGKIEIANGDSGSRACSASSRNEPIDDFRLLRRHLHRLRAHRIFTSREDARLLFVARRPIGSRELQDSKDLIPGCGCGSSCQAAGRPLLFRVAVSSAMIYGAPAMITTGRSARPAGNTTRPYLVARITDKRRKNRREKREGGKEEKWRSA